MDFIDPVVQPKADTTADNTPQAVNQLENEIDKAYTTVEKKFADLWTSVGKNTEELQQKYHLEEHKNELLKQLNDARANIEDKTKAKEHLAEFEAKIKSLSEQIPVKALDLKSIDLKALGTQANGYLDTLDSKLEVVEQQAGKYVSQFTSFLSGIVSVNQDATPPEKEDKEVLFTTKLGSNPNYGTSRYDSDLFKLHTTPELYLDEKLDGDLKSFDVDSKTKDISDLVARYDNTLHKLMNELVPVKIAYNVFWYRYFKLEDNLKKQDEQRKKLLETKETKKAEEDDFNWDDDDDEEPVDVGKDVKDKDDWE
ncbi:protein Dos2p [[Candida] jaroonii]|uniref:Protein Dos2p n=1 Tax=[Candida] jaroonii TaxID=467808 RepID=A0ACA9Y667_9ASCO|nr:protein Dos2p [[Candida] jaroonii]